MSILLFSLLAPISQAYAATITSTIGTAVGRDYSTITAWEAALGGAAGGAGNDAVGEVYNDGVITEATLVQIDDVTPDSVTLTVPLGERHNGIAGTGARVTVATNRQIIRNDLANFTIEWLELYVAGAPTGAQPQGIHVTSNVDDGVVANNIIHGFTARDSFNDSKGIRIAHTGSRGWKIMNNIVYDISQNNAAATQDPEGIEVIASAASMEILNNTVHDITTTGAGGVGITAGALSIVTNNISTDSTNSDFGTGTQSYNLSSDATATGTGAVPSVAAVDQFVSTAGGTEDLHLKAGADALLAGTDLGTTPTGVNIDINGLDRDSLLFNWDIGAHQFSNDNTDPSVNTLSPTDGSTSVGLTDNLIITFTEAVDVETGNINLYKASDDSVVETIDVTSANVTGTGTTTITINPTGDLEDATDYYVQIDATAFDDTAGNSYAGINDTTTWNFSTTLTVDEEVFSIALTINGGGLAKRGDILKGTLSLTNTKGTIITNTDVRLKLPQGINYIADTATSSDDINISRITRDEQGIILRIASFPRNATETVNFNLAVGSNVQDGETLTLTIHTENT